MDKPVEVSPYGRTSRPRVGPPRLVWLAVLILVILLLAAAVVWRLTHQTATTGGMGRFGGATPSVGVVPASYGTIENHLQELGTVTPLAGVTVTSQVSGYLESVGFTEGQTVKKGDFLAQIDDRPYRALLAQYQGVLAHDQGLLAQAQSDLTRYENEAKQDSVAQQTVTDQLALVKQDEGTVAADQAQVTAQQLNIQYCHITAPVAGVVGLRQVDPGNYITAASSTGIVVLNQISPISVIFAIPEDNIPELHKTLRSGQAVPIVLYDRSDTDRLGTGTLSTIDNEINTSTGTLRMRAIFPNADQELVPNQFVNVDMLVSTLRHVLTVPVAALQTGAPGTYVYTVDSDNLAHVTTVKVGAQDANNAQILSGLDAGDRVVTDGVDRLRDGIKVTVTGPGPVAIPTATPRRRRRRSGGWWSRNGRGGATGGAPFSGSPGAGGPPGGGGTPGGAPPGGG